MNGKNARGRVSGIVFSGTAVLLICFFFGEMDLYRAEAPGWHIAALTAGFAGLILLAFPALRLIRGRIGRGRGKLLLLLAAVIVPRVIWWFAVPARIDSDYGLYVSLATDYAEHGAIRIDNYLLTIAPNAALYAVLLGLTMRVFGATALTAQGACMVLHACNIFLLYAVGKRLTTERRAFAAALAFALLPENVFYSHLPGIEAAALGTLLAGLWLVLRAGGKKTARQAALCFGGGAVLAFSACIRPNAWAAAAGAVLWLLHGSGAKGSPGRKALALLAFAIGAAAVLLWHQAFREAIFAGEQPVAGLGWPLYEGLDLESGGRWTPEKSKRCIEVIGSFSPAEADRVFLNEAAERFRGYSLPEKIRMVLRKEGSLWYDCRYSLFCAEGSEAFRKLNDFAALGWACCLAAWIRSLFYRAGHPLGRKEQAGCALCLFIAGTTAAWHAAATSIGRYHYMLIPFVLLMLGMMFPGRAETDQSVKEK